MQWRLSRLENYFLLICTIVFLFISIYFLFPFTADDSFIVARYAHNLVHLNALVFNAGEHISALTSPLQPLIQAALVYVDIDPIVGFKLFSLAVLIGSLLVAGSVTLETFQGKLLFFALAATSPFVLLWTFGGLETAVLSAVIVTLTAVVLDHRQRSPATSALTAGALAGLAFLLRHDSVLFTAPALLQLAWNWRRRPVALALMVAAGAVPAFGWIAFAYVYYGEILPTSFFVKVAVVPLTIKHFMVGALIFLTFLIYSLLWMPFLIARIVSNRARNRERDGGVFIGLLAGLTCTALFSMANANMHMMFGYRQYVPYLGAAALMIVAFLEPGLAPRRTGYAIGVIVALNTLGLAAVLLVSVNYGVALLGALKPEWLLEYLHLGARSYYQDFVPALSHNASAMRNHWQVHGDSTRPPKIATFAGGVLPWREKDAYIFEALVSYRTHCDKANFALNADYVQTFSPWRGSIEKQLVDSSRFTLVDSVKSYFNGSPETVSLYYQVQPLPYPMPSRMNDPCPQ